jgi:hypothetical protein
MRAIISKKPKPLISDNSTNGLPPILISFSTACGKEFFYPENAFGANLLTVMNGKRKAYLRAEIKGLRAMGFPIEVIAKKVDIDWDAV